MLFIEIQEINNAELLSVLNITQNKGFYLTTVEDTLALFGFINDNVFLLKKFRDLSQINLQARFYDKSGNNDLYIVRLDSYKPVFDTRCNRYVKGFRCGFNRVFRGVLLNVRP